MPFRTTTGDVAAIVDVDAGDDLTPYVDAANQLVTDCCSTFGYTDDKLARIEKWLAAHFYVIFNPRSQSETARGVGQVNEALAIGKGLWLTKYGQQALMLDTAGGLAAMTNTLESIKGTLPGRGPAAFTQFVGNLPHHHRRHC